MSKATGENTAIVWLRQDLRLADNPALAHACENFEHVIPVYIWDPDGEGDWPPGGASRWWLHHSLEALDKSLRKRHSRLILRAGDSQAELQKLIKTSKARAVFWNRRYEPVVRKRDADIKSWLKDELNLECRSFNSALWWEPWELETGQGNPYRVFTPMWKRMLNDWRYPDIPATPQPFPAMDKAPASVALDKLKLLPKLDWDAAFYDHWQPGEDGAWAQLDTFTERAMANYLDNRNLPAEPDTSRLSPHLHFGEISTRQIVRQLCPDGEPPIDEQISGFIRELAWREFSWHLLFHYPHIPNKPLQEKFAGFPWRDARTKDYKAGLKAWQQGMTGIPMVDAGMRELWVTGWMHNRVRMLVASFLTKNLLIPWQAGEAWFWDTLVDADLGNNSQGWQWTAGCGADAAPYFRIFNPVTQGERFDPDGEYIRRWIPELDAIKGKAIHSPWAIDRSILKELGIELGKTYPKPLVDLKKTRQRALDAYQEVR